MRYPYGDETRKKQTHDRRRYYPTHFLPCRHLPAGNSAASTSETVSKRIGYIGILFSLKGGYFWAFYRWLKRDYGDWFVEGALPERTRLERLLTLALAGGARETHQD